MKDRDSFDLVGTTAATRASGRFLSHLVANPRTNGGIEEIDDWTGEDATTIDRFTEHGPWHFREADACGIPVPAQALLRRMKDEYPGRRIWQ